MKLSKYTKFREEKFGGVLFETRSEKVFALNPTAAAVLQGIGNGADFDGVLEQLRARFDDRDGALERDAIAFITQLRQEGLIEE